MVWSGVADLEELVPMLLASDVAKEGEGFRPGGARSLSVLVSFTSRCLVLISALFLVQLL